MLQSCSIIIKIFLNIHKSSLTRYISLVFTTFTITNFHLYSQRDYKIKFGKLIRIIKNNKEIVILKNKVKFITRQIKIYTDEIIMKNIGKNTYLIGKKEIFFLLTSIKGKCRNFRGNLNLRKLIFFHCNLRITLENKVNLYAFSRLIDFKTKYAHMILKDTYFTTCSLPKPHYKIKFRKAYIGLKRVENKTIINKLYLQDIKNTLLVIFTGFKKNFYLIKNGEPQKSLFQGVNFSNRRRFKRTITSYFRNTLNLTSKSKLDFKIYPSYSTKRGFFIEYEHTLNTPFFKENTESFYLNDNIKKPEDEFEKSFFPPETRNRYFYHSYGGVFIKGINTKYEIYKISDENLFQELFPHKFKNEKQAETYLNIQKFIKDNIYIRFFIRPNMNNFIEQTEYLPMLKLGILNSRITDKLNFTSSITFSYMERKNTLLFPKNNTTRLTTKNLFTYKIYEEFLDINLYSGIIGNYYTDETNNKLSDKTMLVYGIGIAKPLIYRGGKYQYYGLFETKYINAQNIVKNSSSSAFFDKEDIAEESGEFFISQRNNINFGYLTIEYNIYQELYTRKNPVANQTSFYPFEFPENFSKTNQKAKSHIQDIKLNVNNFSAGIRYENSLGKLFTKKPYLFSLYGEYKKKNKFIIRTSYHLSENIANAIEIYTNIKLTARYYASVFLNYYFNEHRIISNVFSLTRDFHDFYFGINFSKDTLRNEIMFSFTFEPKFGEKNIYTTFR